VRHLVAELHGVLPRVRDMVDGGRVSAADLRYPEFNNGCEIIP
jgi:hypothetical protein